MCRLQRGKPNAQDPLPTKPLWVRFVLLEGSGRVSHLPSGDRPVSAVSGTTSRRCCCCRSTKSCRCPPWISLPPLVGLATKWKHFLLGKFQRAHCAGGAGWGESLIIMQVSGYKTPEGDFLKPLFLAGFKQKIEPPPLHQDGMGILAGGATPTTPFRIQGLRFLGQDFPSAPKVF